MGLHQNDNLDEKGKILDSKGREKKFGRGACF